MKEWLWLLLLLLGLGLLWLAIQGMEKLVNRVKLRDELRKAQAEEIGEKVAREEEQFLRVQAAKDYIENADTVNHRDPNKATKEFKEALEILSSDDLLDSMVKMAFGNNQATDSIKATRSAFQREPAKQVTADGQSINPVRAKAAEREALSKAERKIYKKIKKGS